MITNTGKVQVKKVDAETNYPIEGVTFQLLKMDGTQIGSAKTNAQGIATFSNLHPGTYQLKEILTGNNYILNSEVFNITVEYNETTTKTVTNYPKKGSLKINKTDSETSDPISGVRFELLDLEGNIISSGTTNEKGELTFPNLRIGKYKLKETDTNKNYVVNETIFEVEIEYNKTTVKNITNDYKKGNIKISKIDSDTSQGIAGIIFDLFSNEFQRVVGTYSTDVNGIININNLRIGEYSLIEKNTGNWYELAEDSIINITWNDTTEALVENELKKGQVKVIKLDEENNAIKLEGVEFEILNENGEVLEKIVTNENGEAISKKYPIRDFSKLKIRETKTLENYELSNEVKTVTLEQNKITEVTFTNKKIKGKIEITKISADNNEITNETKGTLLEGAVFEIYTENDVLVDTLTTGRDGKCTSKLLEYGTYYIKEKSSGSDYYLLNTEKYYVEIKENEKVVPITIENSSVKVEKTLPKTGF